jgi:hypothetical protein
MEPTIEQLHTFYRVVYDTVRMSCFTTFVELGENGLLVAYIGKFDDSGRYKGFYVSITPTGEYADE